MNWARAEPDRHPGHRQQRNGVRRQADQPAGDRVRTLRGRHSPEHAHAVHPVGQHRPGRQRVGTAAGEADQPQGVDVEDVAQLDEVLGPVDDVRVEVRGGGADARAVDPDDPQVVLLGERARLDRDLAPGAGGAVHPDDRSAAGTTELGEGEPSTVTDGHRTLEPRTIDVAHARILARRNARQAVSGICTAAESTTLSGSCAAPTRVPSATPSGPSTTVARRHVTLSRPPAASAASSSASTAASSG